MNKCKKRSTRCSSIWWNRGTNARHLYPTPYYGRAAAYEKELRKAKEIAIILLRGLSCLITSSSHSIIFSRHKRTAVKP